MELKLNISNPKDGTTTPLTIQDSKPLQGIKIGQEFKGELVDKTGYIFLVTGGSDSSGFPMRSDVIGATKQKILVAGGVGFNPKRNGIRVRKTVAGNTVGPKTAQLNVKITKEGSKPLIEQASDDTQEQAEEQ